MRQSEQRPGKEGDRERGGGRETGERVKIDAGVKGPRSDALPSGLVTKEGRGALRALGRQDDPVCTSNADELGSLSDNGKG